jgi:hypothetical protein
MATYTKKMARQRTRQRLQSIRKSLGQCAYNWDDLDQVVVNEIEEAQKLCDDIEEAMDESVNEEEESRDVKI